MRIHVNGREREVDAASDTPLLWVLREDLGLSGTKYGCGIGMCGACTVHIDGRAVRSCSVQLENVTGHVTTIEWIAEIANHPVLEAWKALDVPQCGYCQPGMVMAVTALLEANPNPTAEDIRASLSNICRCGTYSRVLGATQQAAVEIGPK